MAWKMFWTRRIEWLENELFESAKRHAADVLMHQQKFERVVELWKEQACRQVDAEARLVDAHRTHVAAIEALNLQLQFEAMRERTELKKAHAEELNRVIEENQKLRDDIDRIRLLLTPALQNVELPKERSASPPPMTPVFTGTPWQRVQQREMAKQDAVAAAKHTKPAEAPLGGESHGSSSERRVDAPLGGESKPA